MMHLLIDRMCLGYPILLYNTTSMHFFLGFGADVES